MNKIRVGRVMALLNSQGENEGPKLALYKQIFFPGSKYPLKPLKSDIFCNMSKDFMNFRQ